jgi:cell division protein ZapA
MSAESPPVRIQLLGKDYGVACSSSERQDLLAAARLLDEKMREIRDAARHMNIDRVAIMAALNFAGELLNVERGQHYIQEGLDKRIAQLHEKLDAALQERAEEVT